MSLAVRFNARGASAILLSRRYATWLVFPAYRALKRTAKLSASLRDVVKNYLVCAAATMLLALVT